MPKIHVQFVRATDDPIAGIGEEIIGWVAPAICNAVFAATGIVNNYLDITVTESYLPDTQRRRLCFRPHLERGELNS
jgi:hypothetical protein